MTDYQSEMKKNADDYNNTGELENTALSQRSQSQQHVQYDSIYMKPKNRQDCYVVIKIKIFSGVWALRRLTRREHRGAL